ncbi:MAG: DNA primase [Abditibacteriota bacterium]|nr:DNA primase [Abditibacteriota bacterium]
MANYMYSPDEIREKCDMIEIVSEYVSLRQRGNRYLGCCPFHKEKTPSFYVDPDKKLFKCFGCGEGGDVFSFVQKAENISFPEAVEPLAKKYNIPMRASEGLIRAHSKREKLIEMNTAAADFFSACLRKSPHMLEYLKKRHLTEDIVKKYGLGYAPDDWSALTDLLKKRGISPEDAAEAGLSVKKETERGVRYYDRFRNRLMFPITNTSGSIIAFGGRVTDDSQPKYLNSPETAVFEKNKTLYGLDVARKAIKPGGFLIITEGYMDVIAAHKAGFLNTAATLGTALTPEHVTLIGRYTHNVVLSFDADSAGVKAALRSAPLFEEADFRVRILSLPKGEDPDSLINSGQADKFAEYIKNSKPLADFRIDLELEDYDKKDDAEKAEALKNALKIVAELKSVIDRERLIQKLAKYHPGFKSGTAHIEEQLRAEANRMIPRRGNKNTTGGGPVITRADAVRKSEELILSLILKNGTREARFAFGKMAPDQFVHEDTKLLAKALEAQTGETYDTDKLRAELAGTPADALLIDLLMRAGTEEECDVSDPISRIQKRNEQQEIARLSALIREGKITSGSEDWDRYWKLLKKTKNQSKEG